MVRKLQLHIITLTLLLVVLPLQICVAKEENSAELSLVYFYENACDSCNKEQEFIDFLNDHIGEEQKDVNLNLLMYNTFHTNGSQLIKKYFKDYKVPKDKQKLPIIFIEDTFLAGDREIELQFRNEFLKAKKELVASSSKSPPIFYFHVTSCNSCEEVEKFLETLQFSNIHKFNIGELNNLELIKNYFKAYNVPEKDQSVPIIFIGDTYLAGEDEIKQHLAEKVEKGQNFDTPVLLQDGFDSKFTEGELSKYGVMGVLVTGFINGLNPCSISMLLFFLSMLTIKNKNVLKMGLSFILGKFMMYFLLGTLLFNIFAKLDMPWFQTTVKIGMVILVLIMAFLNFRDYFMVRKEEYDKVRMQLPTYLRKKNHQWIKKFTSTGDGRILMSVSFGLGALIAVGEFLCTGQIYLATIISLLHNNKSLNSLSLAYFIIYGLAFVFPLLLLTIFVYKGREIFDVSEWVREKMPMIKLITAITFVVFGLFILIFF